MDVNSAAELSRAMRILVDEGAILSARFTTADPHMIVRQYGGGAAAYYGMSLKTIQRHAAYLDEVFADVAAGAALRPDDVAHLLGMARALGQLEEIERASISAKECPNCGGALSPSRSRDPEILISSACGACPYNYMERVM